MEPLIKLVPFGRLYNFSDEITYPLRGPPIKGPFTVAVDKEGWIYVVKLQVSEILCMKDMPGKAVWEVGCEAEDLWEGEDGINE